jgi:hypothetical protein
MRKAGDLLSAIIDENMIYQARNYSELFHSWVRLTAKHGIAAAADHSRIRELERNVLLVEADHPGWIQILQTKSHKLLADLQSRFPDLALTGISIRLSRQPPLAAAPESVPPPAAAGEPAIPSGEDVSPEPAEPGNLAAPVEKKKSGYEGITDEKLRDLLKSLEEHIRVRHRGKK